MIYILCDGKAISMPFLLYTLIFQEVSLHKDTLIKNISTFVEEVLRRHSLFVEGNYVHSCSLCPTAGVGTKRMLHRY